MGWGTFFLFRTMKLTVAGVGQYWGGGPPGKPFGCCWLFCLARMGLAKSHSHALDARSLATCASLLGAVHWAPARVLTVAGLGQCWGGGPPGMPAGCCWIFAWHAWSLANCTSLLGSIFWAAAALPPPQPQLGLLGPGRLTSPSPGTPI